MTTSFLRFPLMLGALLATALLTLAFAVPSAQAGKAWVFKEAFGPSSQPTFDPARSTLAHDDDGRLYVFNHAGPDTLSRWNPDGSPANFAALGTNVIDGAKGPEGKACAEETASCDETPQDSIGGFFTDQVAVDNSGPLGINDGNIYLTDRVDGLVNIFDADGTFLDQLTASDEGPLDGPEFANGPAGVAVDDDGAVYVADRLPGVVHKYEPAAEPPVNTDNTASFSIPQPRHLAAGAGPTDGFVFVGGNSGIRKMDADSGSVQYNLSSQGYEAVAVDPTTGSVFGFGGGIHFTEFDASSTAEATVLAHVEDAGGGEILGIAPFDAGESLYFHRGGLENVQIWEAVASQEVETGPPALISGAKATVTGTVKPFGTDITECHFAYVSAKDFDPGAGDPYAAGETAPCDPDADNIPIDGGTHHVSGELSGMLANGATYHYRLVTNGVASVKGEDRSFKTATTYTTDPASGLTGTEATLNGTVKPEGVELTDCYFEYGTAFLSSREPCEPEAASIPNTDSDVPVSLELSDLDPGATYRFRLVAENSLGKLIGEEQTFTIKGKPVVEQQPIDVTQTTATLQARINPVGSDTTFHFEWGPDTDYGTRIPVDIEQSAGEGTVPVVRTGFVSGLEPASTYHFRVVATNAFGTTVGPDQPFETLNERGLPDNRAFELVTPADKGSSGSISDLRLFGSSRQQLIQASPEGDAFMYPLLNGLDTSTAGGYLRQRAVRTSGGWLSTQISAPSLIPPPGTGVKQVPSHAHFTAPKIGCSILESYNPLTEDTPQASVELGVLNLYRWNGADGSYTLISNQLPLNPEAAHGGDGVFYEQVEASDDCRRVYFKSDYELIEGASGLYEWDEGTLRDAGVLPDGSVGASMGSGAGHAVPGGEVDISGTGRWNAVSPDGQRLFFTAIANEGPSSGTPAVFMREERGASFEQCEEAEEFDDCVVEISASETAIPTNGARFEAASADGTHVFFRANYGIDAEISSAGPSGQACGPLGGAHGETEFSSSPKLEQKPCDLYAYDVAAEEFTDLSADADAPGAEIQGVVAVDEDGSHVYFAAHGQLVTGQGRTYAQNIAGFGSANVYLAHDGQLSYVTTLAEHGGAPGGGSTGDLLGTGQSAPVPGAALMRRAEKWAANTTPDGGELLFVSSLNLTGWESGGVDKYAAYLYSADTGRLTCISCRPDGRPSIALSRRQLPNGTLESAQSSWLLAGPQSPGGSYRPRSISDDGSRIFFTSPDVLAPGAVAGSRNVYQWQHGQVSFLTVADSGGVNGVRQYLDAGASGDDIFIGTAEQLVPQDVDFLSDVYDIRVEGGFPFSEPAPECQVNDTVPLEPNQAYCQGDSSAQPDDPAPSSAGFAGAGNVGEKAARNPCARRARRAQALSKRAKALRRRAKRASSPKATRRNANRARRAARAARRNSKAAKRCRRRARSANTNRGGNR